ncbi:hypothetical protein ACFVIZ_19015 [Streptomyces anulatus]|uniref:hypothetical protein n=1 Tax=Streptomyces anulatus TaxID=1892 RepID=UPI0036275696
MASRRLKDGSVIGGGSRAIERDRIAARIQDLNRAQTKLGSVIENVTAANVAQD